MKKLLVALLAFSLILLTGCVDVVFHLTINRDGSGTYTTEVLMDSSWLDMMREDDGEDPLLEIGEDAEMEGWTVEYFTSEDETQEGVRVTMELDSITVEALDTDDDMAFSGQGLRMTEVGGGTKYEFDLVIDLTDMGEMEGMEDFLSYTFKISLPFKADTHNATSISENERELTWTLRPGHVNEIQFTAVDGGGGLGSILLWVGIIGGAVLLLIVVIVIIVVIKKR